MQVVFSKKFLSPSSDLIAIFAGLESIDQVFFDLLDHLSAIIKLKPFRDGSNSALTLSVQVNSIRAATITAGGAYQTSLASYFTNRDIFGSIMSFIDMDGTEEYVGDAFSLIGILASYDKLEALNPYRTRLADFVDHHGMLKSVNASGHVWQVCYDRYISYISDFQGPIRSDQVNIGLSAYYSLTYWIGGKKGSPPDSNNAFSKGLDDLPLEIISLTLATYEFINANKVYAKLLLECPASSDTKGFASSNAPFVNFLSLCTYLFQNQHRATRAALYARLNLLILRLLVEAPLSSTVTSLLLAEELRTNGISVCRQRAPNLPVVTSSNGRLLIEGLLDSLQCAIRYNTKRGLDVEMYTLAFTVLFQTIHLLRQSKFGLDYHWSELWKSIMSLIKFINSHPPEVNKSSSNGVSGSTESIPTTSNTSSASSEDYVALGRLIILVLASALIHGDTIFADISQYDDLLYKIMEASESLNKFGSLIPSLNASPSMSVLKAAINHYNNLLKSPTTSQSKKSFFFPFKSDHASTPAASTAVSGELTPQKVAEIIREGYQTLSLHQHVMKNGTGSSPKSSSTASATSSRLDQSEAAYLLYDPLPRFNESDERLFLKRMTRQVIVDVQHLHSELT